MIDVKEFEVVLFHFAESYNTKRIINGGDFVLSETKDGVKIFVCSINNREKKIAVDISIDSPVSPVLEFYISDEIEVSLKQESHYQPSMNIIFINALISYINVWDKEANTEKKNFDEIVDRLIQKIMRERERQMARQINDTDIHKPIPIKPPKYYCTIK